MLKLRMEDGEEEEATKQAMKRRGLHAGVKFRETTHIHTNHVSERR